MGLTGMDAAKHHRASGAAVARPAARKHSLCEHKRQRSRCRECGGVGICPHGREFRRCKDCKGPGLCKHLREKKSCKECYAGQTLPGNCQHNRRKSLCRECGGAGICEHNRIRSRCKECGGRNICEHKRIRSDCRECPVNICSHNRREGRCGECLLARAKVAQASRAAQTAGQTAAAQDMLVSQVERLQKLQGDMPRKDTGMGVGAKRPAAAAPEDAGRAAKQLRGSGTLDPKPNPWQRGSGTAAGPALPPSARKPARKHSLCEHKRQRSRCRECGGVGICPHGREFRKCKDCKGPGLCKHLREKKSCKECYAGQTLPGNCQHNRRKSLCRECGGAGICEHNRIRSRCKECGGRNICEHKRIRSDCRECLMQRALQQAKVELQVMCVRNYVPAQPKP
jgi:hypothetical protein